MMTQEEKVKLVDDISKAYKQLATVASRVANLAKLQGPQPGGNLSAVLEPIGTALERLNMAAANARMDARPPADCLLSPFLQYYDKLTDV